MHLDAKPGVNYENKLAVGGGLGEGLEEQLLVRITEEIEVAIRVGGGARGLGLAIRQNNTRRSVEAPEVAIGGTEGNDGRVGLIEVHLVDGRMLNDLN